MDITPKQFPVFVSGWFLESTASEVNEPLHARALVLDDGQNRIAVCVVDTLVMACKLINQAKHTASQTTGIPTSHMLIAVTHTHSAPSVMGALGTGIEEDYARLLPDLIAQSIAQAVVNLRPAQIGFKMVEDFQHTNCHRWIRRPDHIGLDPFGQETVRAMMHPGYQNPDYIGPAGPKDADLSILAVQPLDGCPLALLANYSMHYFGAQPVSADYFGLFAWKLAAPLKTANLEPPFVGIMSQGTSGDLHWMDYSEPQKPIDIGTYTDQIVEVVYQAWQQINYRDWLPYARTTLGSVIIVLSLWLLGLNSHIYAKLNTDLINAMPITEQLPAHTILASGAGECTLPNCPGEWNGFAVAFGQNRNMLTRLVIWNATWQLAKTWPTSTTTKLIPITFQPSIAREI